MLEKENKQIKIENEDFRVREKEFVETIQVLQQQVNILKASVGKLEGNEKAHFEKDINRHIKNLDKCIAVLNK